MTRRALVIGMGGGERGERTPVAGARADDDETGDDA